MSYRIMFVVVMLIWVLVMAVALFLAITPSDFNIRVDNWLNVRNKVNKKCEIDFDCNLKITNCDSCDCESLDAVNRAWKPFCPFPGEKHCEPCKTRLLKAKCVDGICTMQKR